MECEYLSSEQVDSELEDEPEDSAFSVESFQSREGLLFSILERTRVFRDLVDCATRHFENTGRHLQVWGELGEIYAEIQFGLRRYETGTAGSDGIISGNLAEEKTILPERSTDWVTVKSKGDFHFKAKLFDRRQLKGDAQNVCNSHRQCT